MRAPVVVVVGTASLAVAFVYASLRFWRLPRCPRRICRSVLVTFSVAEPCAENPGEKLAPKIDGHVIAPRSLQNVAVDETEK